ncbi:MAG TPA: HAMP domain-containing sensor histidine kinase [Chthonomonadaceae bacterium]|nr:HAMP domain-containing sensor histidine kinase [Chthonomonadaceae bacterium]
MTDIAAEPDVASSAPAHAESAAARDAERELLQDIREEAQTRLWHVGKQAWTRKGVLSRAIAALVHDLGLLVRTTARSDSDLLGCLKESRGLWSETGLRHVDILAAADIVLEHVVRRLPVCESDAAPWIARAAVEALKADLGSSYLRAQGEELARHRDENIATRHITGRFLANASHDLRTPLTAVLGFSELLLEDTYGPLNDAQRTAVGHIENSAQNLHEIVGNLLDLMRSRAGKMELQYHRIAVTPVLAAIYDILVPLSKRREVEFGHRLAENLGSMDADDGILRHIVYNLLESALRATPAGGEVVLQADRADSTLSIVVLDNALHFPPEAIEKMSDSFPIIENSPARGYDSWEIGLPLVRRYVEMLNGTLSLESNPDSGTAITVRLPTERPAAAR